MGPCEEKVVETCSTKDTDLERKESTRLPNEGVKKSRNEFTIKQFFRLNSSVYFIVRIEWSWLYEMEKYKKRYRKKDIVCMCGCVYVYGVCTYVRHRGLNVSMDRRST